MTPISPAMTIEQTGSSLMRGLLHIATANEYFEDIRRGNDAGTRRIFGQYTNKLQWIIADVKSMAPESSELLRRDLQGSDVLFHSAIGELSVGLSPSNRERVEEYIRKLLKEQE